MTTVAAGPRRPWERTGFPEGYSDDCKNAFEDVRKAANHRYVHALLRFMQADAPRAARVTDYLAALLRRRDSSFEVVRSHADTLRALVGKLAPRWRSVGKAARLIREIRGAEKCCRGLLDWRLGKGDRP